MGRRRQGLGQPDAQEGPRREDDHRGDEGEQRLCSAAIRPRYLPDLSCFGLVGTPVGDQERRGSDAHNRSGALCDLNLAFATSFRIR
jgi:hypothetical protein